MQIRDIQLLRGWSIRAWARHAAVNDSALAGWLQGIPGRLGPDRIVRVLGVLGISEAGVLRRDMVHPWEIRDTDGLDALRRALKATGSAWTLVPVAFGGDVRLPPVPLYALRSDRVRALIRSRPRWAGFTPFLPSNDPLGLPGSSCVGWADGVSLEQPQQIDDATGRAWWDGAQIGMDVFDELFGPATASTVPTWADVQRMAEAAGISPARAIAMMAKA